MTSRSWALLALVAACSCSRDNKPLQRYECTCSFLTDFDDPSGQSVVICQTDRQRAEAAAKGCAQSAAPAPVQQCRCSVASKGAEACKSGYCHVKEHR